jgi:pimeloyl-ACP methyl ester carboxylesterase
MASFTEERHEINGIETVVLTAGEGEDLVFFHGAGTVTGFDSLLPLAERFRLVVPFHPGFGPSADDPAVDAITDYARHYLDLFDRLGIGEMSLVGHSMGGWLAATFAIDHTERVRRLVLAAPLGLRVPEHPTADIFVIPNEEFLEHLAADHSIFEGRIPDPPTPEFLAGHYREMTSTARLLWERNHDLKLPRWLHRLTMPTLLLWGEADRIIPAAQIDAWSEYVPGADRRTLPGVGHLLFDESAEAVTAAGDFVGEELIV